MARPHKKPPSASPFDASASFRDQLTVGEEVIDPTTFAGSIPAVNGVAPRIRIGRDRWCNLLWPIPIGFATALVLVAVAQALRDTSAVSSFIQRHPGADITPQVERGRRVASIGVLDAHRRGGIGRSLMHVLPEGLPHERPLLMTSSDPSDAARRLYASEGWRVLGPGMGDGSVIMGRRTVDPTTGVTTACSSA
jgi:GNAT superfamily N-acetyltransferase